LRRLYRYRWQKGPVRRSDNVLATLFGVNTGTVGELYSEDIRPYSQKKKEKIANYCLEIAIQFIALTL